MQIPTIARQTLNEANGELRRLHSRVLGLREYVAELDRTVVIEAQVTPAPNATDGHIQNQKAAIIPYVFSETATRHSSASNLLRILENSPEFKDACSRFEPLIAAAAAEEVEEAAIRAKIAEHECAHRAAVEVAEAKARAAAASDPDVLAAAKALSKLTAK